jgi:hypothetical protein
VRTGCTTESEDGCGIGKAMLERLQCWHYGREGFKKYAIEMALRDIMCIPNFRKSGTGVQAILMFCLLNMRSCNVGVTEDMDL